MPGTICKDFNRVIMMDRDSVCRLAQGKSSLSSAARIALILEKAYNRKAARDAEGEWKTIKGTAVKFENGEPTKGPPNLVKAVKAENRSESESKKESVGRASTGVEYADRKIAGYLEDPKSLGNTTHREKYDDFVSNGVDVKPLARGSQKGKPYEQGGGYKVGGSEDGRMFSYHPESGSHHGGEYYKLASGKTGPRRYNMDGTEKRDKKAKEGEE